MQDAEEAWEIGTDVLLIKCEFFDGVRRSIEQSGVSHALVLPHEGAQFFRDRKSNEKMVTWELALNLFLQPLLGLTVLAGGAMTITTGAIELAWLGTAITLVEGDPAGFGAASHDGIDDFALRLGYYGSIALEVLGAEGYKDFMDGVHDRVPPSRD
jgi:hypothetical protein